MAHSDSIVRFGSAGEIALWYSINDAIMGGISSGRLVEHTDATALFTGEVSLERGGGFASIRTRPGRYDLSGYKGVVLKVRGDGKRYKLNILNEARLEGVLFQASWTSGPGVWEEITLPMTAFVPTFRGRVLAGHPPLDPGKISSFGLMISDRQAGHFALEIEWLRAHR